jgi:hypothetical protein
MNTLIKPRHAACRRLFLLLCILHSTAGCDGAPSISADPENWDLNASAEDTAFESRKAILEQRDIDGHNHSLMLGLEEGDRNSFWLSYFPARRQECTLRVVGTAVDVTELGLEWEVRRAEMPDSSFNFEVHTAVFSTTSRFAYLLGIGDKLALKVAHQCDGLEGEFERVWVFDTKGADVAMAWLRDQK